jgi:hypothetical protein
MIDARFALLTPAIFAFLGCTSNGSERAGVSESKLSVAMPTVCDPGRLQIAVSPSVKECCQLGTDLWFVSPRNGGIAHLTGGPICSTLDGGTDCVGFQCFFGPCKGETIVSVMGGPPSHVFKPASNPAVCGWQAGGDGFDPEPYTNQELYPPAVTACPWTICAGGGRPGVDVTVIAVANGATGHVESEPAGIDLEGTDHAVVIFTQLDVTLTAKALGPHARVQFSGGCSESGGSQQPVRCKLSLPVHRMVTVTYECEPGWTCHLE